MFAPLALFRAAGTVAGLAGWASVVLFFGFTVALSRLWPDEQL